MKWVVNYTMNKDLIHLVNLENVILLRFVKGDENHSSRIDFIRGDKEEHNPSFGSSDHEEMERFFKKLMKKLADEEWS
jgi:hypothetical protein